MAVIGLAYACSSPQSSGLELGEGTLLFWTAGEGSHFCTLPGVANVYNREWVELELSSFVCSFFVLAGWSCCGCFLEWGEAFKSDTPPMHSEEVQSTLPPPPGCYLLILLHVWTSRTIFLLPPYPTHATSTPGCCSPASFYFSCPRSPFPFHADTARFSISRLIVQLIRQLEDSCSDGSVQPSELPLKYVTGFNYHLRSCVQQ